MQFYPKSEGDQGPAFLVRDFYTLNCRTCTIPRILALLDTNGTGLAAHIETESQMQVTCRSFSPCEASSSSTWHELVAIIFSLQAFEQFLSTTDVLWHTDNYAASLMVLTGSRMDKLTSVAEDVHEFSTRRKIELTVEWIPRRFIRTADALSKIPIYDDWETTHTFFNELSTIWGLFEANRFVDQDKGTVGIRPRLQITSNGRFGGGGSTSGRYDFVFRSRDLYY